MAMQLIPLHTRLMNEQSIDTVNARELHFFLELGRDFSNWIKARINQYGFEENSDYSIFSRSPELASGNRGAAKDYFITLDMAKELAMVERNEKGRQARRYFIECEKKLRAIDPNAVQTILSTTIGTDGLHCLSSIIDTKVKRLPNPIQRSAKSRIWSQIHNAYNVRSAEDIPVDQLDSARNFVAAYEFLEGEFIGKDERGGGDIKKRLDVLEQTVVILEKEMSFISEHAEKLTLEMNQKVLPALKVLNSSVYGNVRERLHCIKMHSRQKSVDGWKRHAVELVSHSIN